MRPILVVAAFVLTGCFAPKYKDGDLKCEPGPHACPTGYHCASNKTCWSDGSEPSGSDMAPSLARDMSTSDAAPTGPADMAGADMTPVVTSTTYPPAAVWISAGGGATTTTTSGVQLNLALSPSLVGGTAVSANHTTITFGFFSAGTY
jgi:hypothetical protein